MSLVTQIIDTAPILAELSKVTNAPGLAALVNKLLDANSNNTVVTQNARRVAEYSVQLQEYIANYGPFWLSPDYDKSKIPAPPVRPFALDLSEPDINGIRRAVETFDELVPAFVVPTAPPAKPKGTPAYNPTPRRKRNGTLYYSTLPGDSVRHNEIVHIDGKPFFRNELPLGYVYKVDGEEFRQGMYEEDHS